MSPNRFTNEQLRAKNDSNKLSYLRNGENNLNDLMPFLVTVIKEKNAQKLIVIFEKFYCHKIIEPPDMFIWRV